MEINLVQKIAVWALPVLFAITLHEVAHGWVAKALGDATAFVSGRLTLNPLKHVDPVGTVALPVGLLVLGSVTGSPTPIFGWAKPVPVSFGNLRRPKRDMIWVALAGPGANLAMATFWALLAAGSGLLPGGLAQPLLYMGVAGIIINIVLMVLNLLPIPPLDGGRVAVGILPQPASRWVENLEPLGLPILLVLLFSGALGAVIMTPFSVIASLFLNAAGIHPSYVYALF